MWANAQHDGRPAKYRWRPLFNAAKFGWRPQLECRAVTLPRYKKPLKFAGVPQTRQQISAVSRLKFTILWGHVEEVSVFNKFFSDCRYMPQLRRYSPTKLCDGAKMAIFCVLYFLASRMQHISDMHSKFASHLGHTMCGGMVDIQYPTAEISRGKKRIAPQGKNIMVCPIT